MRAATATLPVQLQLHQDLARSELEVPISLAVSRKGHRPTRVQLRLASRLRGGDEAAASRTLVLVASCPNRASATLGGKTFDQEVMKLMVVMVSATDNMRSIYDQAGSSSADPADYEPGQESAAMRAHGRIGTAKQGKGVVR